MRGRTLLDNGIIGLMDSIPFSELVSKAPIRVYNVLTLLALVWAEVGITVLPRLSLPPSQQDLCFVALKYPMARRTVGLLSRSTEAASPAAEAFAHELKKIVGRGWHRTGLPDGIQGTGWPPEKDDLWA